MTESITNDWHHLLSILHSDDDLQIRASGDFNQICVKLHPNIQIQCFINTSTESLTLNNLHDFHIDKLSTQNSPREDQWIHIRDYFNQLIQQSNPETSLYSIIQSIQEELAKPISKDDVSTSTPTFRDADLIFNRIASDTTIDRFTGIHEVPFNELKKVHEDQVRTNGLSQGMYHFDLLTHQWILCSNVLPDDQKCLPERCQFVTWNILSADHYSEYLYPNERYRQVLKTLQSFLPDIICLQEVTRYFLDLLLEENWLKENNYYVIIMENVLCTNGQMMLIKNVQPRMYEICSLDLSEDSRRNKKYMIARFGLMTNVTIDLINLHLDCSEEQRSKILENLVRKMTTRNYMIIGDLNFGDDDIIEEILLSKSKYQIHDLWKEYYDLDENPGYTFDRIRNTCAQLTPDFPCSLRADRYLLHKLPNLTYSIEDLNMVGAETILIDQKLINPSNHYALQLMIHFQTRTLSHRSTLAILPIKEISSSAYVNVCWPFFDSITTKDDEENLLLPLRLLLAQIEPFDIEIEPSKENPNGEMILNEQSKKSIQQLAEQIQQLFSQWTLNHDNLPMTISQAIQFPVRYIYILRQSSDDHTNEYRITHQLPLGSVLEPIGFHQYDCMNNEIGEFFQRMNLYQNDKSFEQKREKLDRLSRCFESIFHRNAVHCFTYAFFPYGSFRLGLHGDDLDVVLVLSEDKCRNTKTNLDQTLLQLRYDPPALSNHIIDLLERQILNDFKEEIIDCRKIQALYPIISIVFHDQTRVEIFAQTIFNQQAEEKENLLSNFHEPIHGVHDIERLITYVRFPTIFQHLLTFIRTWAHNVGLYGQVYGYLGGYSWAILCAYICHQYLPSDLSLFSIEQFVHLVKKFFSIYANFNWSHDSISLYPTHLSQDTRGAMLILCPSPPFDNSSRSTINSTRYLIIQAFRQACDRTSEDILRLSNRFPDPTIQSVLQLTVSGQTFNELNQWLGYMKSRLAHFLTDCEDDCQLFVQTDNQLECRGKPLERFYSLGFQFNEQIISRHRQFYYSLNKFLDQFKICTWRSETMKLSYKLMSINQWRNERQRS